MYYSIYEYVFYSTLSLSHNKDKENSSRKVNLVDTIIYTERVSRCIKIKHIRGSRIKRDRI